MLELHGELTAQKVRFPFKDFVTKLEQICRKRAKRFNNICRGDHISNLESYIFVKKRVMVNSVGSKLHYQKHS